MHNTDDIFEIDLKEIFVVLMSKLWLIVLCGIVVGTMGLIYSSCMITPQYQSTTKVYILNKQDGSNVTYSDLQMGTTLTKDYKELIRSRSVLETVIKNCELNEKYGSLASRVSVAPISDTRIIAITVEDPDPATAQYLADEIRKVAAKHIKEVMAIEAVNVVDEANLPGSPSSPSVAKWTVLGGALGAFVCACLIILTFLLDDTIKNSEDVEKYLGIGTLAMIPIMELEGDAKKKNRRGIQRRFRNLKLEVDFKMRKPKIGSETTKGTGAREEK